MIGCPKAVPYPFPACPRCEGKHDSRCRCAWKALHMIDARDLSGAGISSGMCPLAALLFGRLKNSRAVHPPSLALYFHILCSSNILSGFLHRCYGVSLFLDVALDEARFSPPLRLWQCPLMWENGPHQGVSCLLSVSTLRSNFFDGDRDALTESLPMILTF